MGMTVDRERYELLLLSYELHEGLAAAVIDICTPLTIRLLLGKNVTKNAGVC
jgi:hypothetical protein